MFVLVSFLISMCLSILDSSLGNPSASRLYGLILFLPSLAATIRRLHDTGRTGWWVLIGAVPVAGAIVLLVFLVEAGTPRDNEYGPDPKVLLA